MDLTEEIADEDPFAALIKDDANLRNFEVLPCVERSPPSSGTSIGQIETKTKR